MTTAQNTRTATLTFTDAEAQLLVDALLAVAPSGGGSAPYALAFRLMGELEIAPDDAKVAALQLRACREVRDNAPDFWAMLNERTI